MPTRAPTKAFYLATLALLGAAFVSSACDDDNNPSDNACTLATEVSDGVGDINVTYTASATGNGTISAFAYNTDAGMVTVTNPTLPYSLTVVLATAHASASAVGSASNGSVTIGWAIASEVSPEQDSVSCTHNND